MQQKLTKEDLYAAGWENSGRNWIHPCADGFVTLAEAKKLTLKWKGKKKKYTLHYTAYEEIEEGFYYVMASSEQEAHRIADEDLSARFDHVELA